MVKLVVGGANDGAFEQLPAMDDVELLLASADFFPAEPEKGYKDRLKFVFQITGGEEAEELDKVGQEHHVYANMPSGKTGKLSSRSNLYKLLEGMSGGDFDPDDEIDTDEYVGKKYRGDFKRVQSQKMVGPGKFVPAFDEDGKPIKKTELQNLKPLKRRKPAVKAQEEFDWGEGEEA